MTDQPNYRLIAREAIPVRADCYDCNKLWTGPNSRDEALAHRAAEGHAVFIEGRPREWNEDRYAATPRLI